MNLKYYDIEQGSEEWFKLRLGKFTASSVKHLFSQKNTQSYKDEIFRVVYERWTGKQTENYVNEYMKRGTELEPYARARYMFETFNDVANGGFFELDEWVGCSPDGLVENAGIIEIKCPKFTTMINYLLKNELPTEYVYQVQMQLWVTGRQWCDFVAYHPELPLLVVKVYPDIKIIQQIQTEIEIAIGLVDKYLKQLRECGEYNEISLS